MLKKIIVTLLLTLSVPVLVFAQNGTISGKVTDQETGAPLAGANVSIVGTSMGAAADIEGKYSIDNVPPGTYQVRASFIGYQQTMASVNVVVGETATLNFDLNAEAIKLSEIVTEVSRAEDRKTPAAFTNVTAEDISSQYTTQDIPALLVRVPGVFANSAGIGEAEIYIRGLNTNHVRVEINGIVTNDPESQKVYFSNWTGLASNANLIQVQRGAGSWLYGSGFGGSMNVNTYGVPSEQGVLIRSSVGMYSTDSDKIADGRGGFESYTPVNYMTQIRYNSGQLAGGKLAYSIIAERKAGDSYVEATNYDGWSFGLELESRLSEKHILFGSFIGAPQNHNQTGAVQDMALLGTLGREYNRRNHPFQENHYFKPQLSFRHFWQIADNRSLTSNLFFTMGRGGGQYLRNDKFITSTGEVAFKDLSESTDLKYFGRHARYIYEITNGRVVLQGYDPATNTFTNSVGDSRTVSKARDLISASFAHSWRNDSQNFHEQGGLNTAYEHQLNDQVKLTVGGEFRHWNADHFADSELFRSVDAATGALVVYDEVQRRYDYTTKTTNWNGFGRFEFTPTPEVNIQVGGQYASSHSEVTENPIQIFDFEAGKFLNETFRTTMDLRNDDGSLKFSKDDYARTYDFFSPKAGINYNLEKVNFFATWSIDHKEPRVGDWFSRSRGPGMNQLPGQDLKAEKLTNYEIGMGYRSTNLSFNANVYMMDFEDKIESVTDLQGERTTINAGKARFKGVELSADYRKDNFDAFASATIAQNRWRGMSVDRIFGVAAADVVDKVVTYSPEKLFNASMGYRFMEQKLRLGLGLQWWDDYYGSFTNTYTLINGEEVSAKLPTFFELKASLSYKFQVGGKNLVVRLDANNLTNHKHFTKASFTRDFNRDDALAGQYYMYVVQAPLRNFFLTTELSL